MKNQLLLKISAAALLVAGSYSVGAQGVSVNQSGADPDASAILDVSSTSQGMLVPRMTDAQRDLIATPATGLLVYQTNGAQGFYFYDGTSWVSLNALSNVTTQGNIFNGSNQLVKTNALGELPAISGANLTNLNFLPTAGGTMNDGANINVGSGTGTQVGTSALQKLGFYGAAPVAQQSGNVATALANLGLVASPSIVATTNANLTGPITSVGNATSVASQTGAGSKFVMDASPTITSPTLVTPALGVATGTSLSLSSSLNEAQGADMASAATTNIGAATGNYLNVTGTTTITSLGTAQAGIRRIVNFKGALTLTHNATSLILPGGANIVTAPEDVAIFVSLGGGNWKCVNYSAAAASGGSGITALTGDVTATGPGSATATLANVATAGTTGSSTAIPVITIDAKGRTTSVSTANVPMMFFASLQSGSGATTTNTYYTLDGLGGTPTVSIVQTEVPVAFTITKMVVTFTPVAAQTVAGAPSFALFNGATAALTQTWASSTYAANTRNTATVTPATPVAIAAGSKLSLMFINGAGGKTCIVTAAFYGYY